MSIRVSIKMRKEVWSNKELQRKYNRYLKISLLPASLSLVLMLTNQFVESKDIVYAAFFIFFPALILLGVAEGLKKADKITHDE